MIGVVSSPTGAVIRDILHRLNDRFPRHVIVWPVRVQGETSAAEVAAAIAGFNAMSPRPDLIIVARGGGSLEDLWSFNEEIVVRAVAASDIPLISAVGHETDTTLIDYVSDFRAPTPSAAAERAVPVRAELLAQVASLAARHGSGARRGMDERLARIRSAARALPRPDEILALARQRHDAAGARLAQALKSNTQHHRASFNRIAPRLSFVPVRLGIARDQKRLDDFGQRASRALGRLAEFKRQKLGASDKLLVSLSYKSVLSRGFALVRDATEKPVHAASAVTAGQGLIVEFADGRIRVREEGGTAS